MYKNLLNFGIVGIGGRPRVFLEAFERSEKARLIAVCDNNKERMQESLKDIPGVTCYTDYSEMLIKEDLDAVIIGTPMPCHIPQSIEALKHNINVFSEVTAGVSVQECKNLVEACKISKAQYMMGENCNYMLPYMIVKNMVKEGLFGELFYAEGEYNHDCRELIKITPWRKKYLYDIGGVNYGTHNLGPILSWFEGDRITKISCSGSSNCCSDLEGNPLNQSSCYIMLCKTEKNRLIKIKNNLSSSRPYGLNFVLEGSNGLYQGVQCGRGNDDDLVYFEGINDKDKWNTITKHENRYIPELWEKYSDMKDKNGHSGADVITMIDYINHLYDGKKVPIDVHTALDMTLPGLISQESVLKDGIWLDVPNSRMW